MGIQVYNTLTRKKEPFEPMTPGEVKVYVCGPTVYDFLHVGNFRGPIFYNVMCNWLEKRGYKVTYVYNFTDVDDKIIQRALEENVEAKDIAEKYTKEFLIDYQSLNLRDHDANPRVSDHMDDIINMIQTLIGRGHAYEVNGEVLYSISSFKEYGKLSGRNPEELLAGARVEVDAKKKDPLDFTLWKPAKEGEPSWSSPWGDGRPGWHIECSAMNHAIHGESIDIHGGGSDLIFPHHENEVAQSEGAHGKTFAKYWMHNNMLTFSGQKMSKSLGNIQKGREFLNEYNGEIMKFLMLGAHYRSTLDFSDQQIENSIRGLARVYSALSLASECANAEGEPGVLDGSFKKVLDEAWSGVETALDDDFNTAEAFARKFEVVRNFNQTMKRGMKVKPAIKAKAIAMVEWLARFGEVTSLYQEEPDSFLRALDDILLQQKDIARSDVDELVKKRIEAREQKDYQASDEIRDQLVEMGIAVSDTPQGTFWEVAK